MTRFSECKNWDATCPEDLVLSSYSDRTNQDYESALVRDPVAMRVGLREVGKSDLPRSSTSETLFYGVLKNRS
jgi:hypothetical protein